MTQPEDIDWDFPEVWDVEKHPIPVKAGRKISDVLLEYSGIQVMVVTYPDGELRLSVLEDQAYDRQRWLEAVITLDVIDSLKAKTLDLRSALFLNPNHELYLVETTGDESESVEEWTVHPINLRDEHLPGIGALLP